MNPPAGGIEHRDAILIIDAHGAWVRERLLESPTVVRHGKGDKIVVFKHKRRKNYARKQGHRQGFTEVKISDINLG